MINYLIVEFVLSQNIYIYFREKFFGIFLIFIVIAIIIVVGIEQIKQKFSIII